MYKYCSCLDSTNKYYHPTTSVDGERCDLCRYYIINTKEYRHTPEKLLQKVSDRVKINAFKYRKEFIKENGKWTWQIIENFGNKIAHSNGGYKTKDSAATCLRNYSKKEGIYQDIYNMRGIMPTIKPISRDCRMCGKHFPLTSQYFHKMKSHSYGFNTKCKACVKLYRLEWENKHYGDS